MKTDKLTRKLLVIGILAAVVMIVIAMALKL